jgi:hypothetical protein
VDGFVGFAIGRSIWEDPIADHNQAKISEDKTVTRIAGRYLGFASRYCAGRTRPSDKGAVMAPGWLTVIAWLYLSACFCCAGIIAYDIAVNHRRQPMGVMNAVYPITALYLGPLALALYWQWGRASRGTAMPADVPEPDISI